MYHVRSTDKYNRLYDACLNPYNCNAGLFWIGQARKDRKELRLFMTIRGSDADINLITFDLRNIDLEYLIKSNVQLFGKYEDIVTDIKKTIIDVNIILGSKIITDLNSIIMSY